MLSHIKRVLIVEPHSDDMVIGVGGTLAKLKEQGCDIEVILLSPAPEQYQKIKSGAGVYEKYSGYSRENEMNKSLEILGIDNLSTPFSSEVHHKLDSISQADIIHVLEDKIKSCQPDVIFIPEASYNQDHRAIYNAMRTVIRPHFYNGVVLAYETTMEETFTPNFLVALEQRHVDIKMQACSCYETQLGEDNHLFSLETIEISMRYRGRLIFKPYSEAFRLIRGVF